MPRSTLPKNFLLEKVNYNILSYTLKNGGVAQMVERSLSMREVPGSIPGASKLFLWLPIFFVYHFEFDFNEIITQKCDLIYCPQKKIIAGKWENVEQVVYTVCLRKHNIFKVHCLKCQGKVWLHHLITRFNLLSVTLDKAISKLYFILFFSFFTIFTLAVKFTQSCVTLPLVCVLLTTIMQVTKCLN